jgi:hypothetical protein
MTFDVLSRVTLNNILMGMAGLGFLMMLISSVGARKQLPTRGRWILGLTGGLGLLSVAASIYWHTYDLYTHSYWGLVRPSVIIYAFEVARRVLFGATIAMVAFVVFPKGAKVLLFVSVTLFIVSEVLLMSHSGYWGLATPLISLANAWAVGMAIPAAILLLLDRRLHELGSR